MCVQEAQHNVQRENINVASNALRAEVNDSSHGRKGRCQTSVNSNGQWQNVTGNYGNNVAVFCCVFWRLLLFIWRIFFSFKRFDRKHVTHWLGIPLMDAKPNRRRCYARMAGKGISVAIAIGPLPPLFLPLLLQLLLRLVVGLFLDFSHWWTRPSALNNVANGGGDLLFSLDCFTSFPLTECTRRPPVND